MMEIWDEQIPPPDGRSNPRVVKKSRAKFPAKKSQHRGAGVKLLPLTFNILSQSSNFVEY